KTQLHSIYRRNGHGTVATRTPIPCGLRVIAAPTERRHPRNKKRIVEAEVRSCGKYKSAIIFDYLVPIGVTPLPFRKSAREAPGMKLRYRGRDRIDQLVVPGIPGAGLLQHTGRGPAEPNRCRGAVAMRRILSAWCWIALCASLSAHAAELPAVPREHPGLLALGTAPSETELRATITALVGFGTRHTLSDTKSATRGIGAARRWVQARFATISRDCGGCLDVVTPAQTFTGKRIPQPTEVVDVVAIKRGSTDPQRVIVITGHLDSRVSDVMNARSDAPGANDDASGVAALIEAARLLSKQDNRATLVFAALSGEEQGLYGGKVLADYAVAHGWQVEAE